MRGFYVKTTHETQHDYYDIRLPGRALIFVDYRSLNYPVDRQ